MTAPVDIAAVTNQIYDKVKSIITHRKVDAAVLIEVATYCMEVVESMGNMPGATKKAVVLAVLSRLVDEIPVGNDMTEMAKADLKKVVVNELPTVIDKLVQFANGDTSIGGEIIAEVIGDSCCGSKKTKQVVAARRRR